MVPAKSRMSFIVSRNPLVILPQPQRRGFFDYIHRVSFQNKLRKSTGALSRHPGPHKCHCHTYTEHTYTCTHIPHIHTETYRQTHMHAHTHSTHTPHTLTPKSPNPCHLLDTDPDRHSLHLPPGLPDSRLPHGCKF